MTENPNLETQPADRYIEAAERMNAMALAAGTPEMRAEFRRLASMYVALARGSLPREGLSGSPPDAGARE